MKKYVLSLLFLLSVSSFLLAQELYTAEDKDKDTFESGFSVTLVPQYAIVGTFKVELDKKIGNSASWLVFAPSYTAHYNDDLSDFNYESRVGGGLSISHRFYMNKTKAGKGVYVQYGGTYNYNQLKYTGVSEIEYQIDGIDVMSYQEKTITDDYHKFGMDFLIGYKIIISSNQRLMLDGYLGMGTRHTRATTTGVAPQNENTSGPIFSPAYEGVLPIGGVRIGVSF